MIGIDIATLSRMTGKDFSGPVPEIKGPEPVLHSPNNNAPDSQSPTQPTESLLASSKGKKRSQSRKARVSVEDGVVILGNADTFEDIET